MSSPTAVHGGSYLGVQLAKSASGVEGDIAVHEVEVVVEAAKQTADCTWPHPRAIVQITLEVIPLDAVQKLLEENYEYWNT